MRSGNDKGEKWHGFVSVNTRDKAEGDLLEENEFESWLFCKKCTEDIRRYVRTLPLKPSQNDEKRDQNKEKCDQNEGKRSEPAKSEAKAQETVSEAAEDESTTGKKKYDVGKIMALKKAGWKVKDIADGNENDTTAGFPTRFISTTRRCRRTELRQRYT